ncbi:MAG TPA: enoyl-CoA hydratase/isomerase family protein [Syntrophales bacterium]|jgi:enoyl-CoA hydratase/carnithine racemase|nr:enoyl-CoA hydratase/isomerase family protein [Syntrophales bacterium]
MPEQKVLIQKKEPLCTFTMNAPKKMNALAREMLLSLEADFNDVVADRNSRVVVLEGAGGNFCSGAELSLLGSGITAEDAYREMLRIGRLIKSMREIPQPVICRVRSVANGGGANLALAGDFVVASHEARISQSFVNIGITLDCGGSYFLPRLVGMAGARALALLGEEIDGKTAVAIGLIYKSAAADELDGEVDTLASVLARKSITALSVIKKEPEREFRHDAGGGPRTGGRESVHRSAG